MARVGPGVYRINIAPGTFSAIALPMVNVIGTATMNPLFTDGFTFVEMTFSQDTIFVFTMLQVLP